MDELTEVQIATSKGFRDAKDHSKGKFPEVVTLLKINWEGLTETQLQAIATRAIVIAVQSQFRSKNFDIIPSEFTAKASEYIPNTTGVSEEVRQALEFKKRMTTGVAEINAKFARNELTQEEKDAALIELLAS